MQALFRIVNLLLGPFLTLVFAAHFADVQIAGQDAGDQVGGALAGLLMLTVEMALTQGPKHSRWLRRWLDPRAAFEGVWLQEVERGPQGNELGVFSVNYERESDTFGVQGYAYSVDGRKFAKWHSTNVFIDGPHRKATYLWDGQMVRKDMVALDKSGLTTLQLRAPPAFSLPMTGDGGVSHVGEDTRLLFGLQRVTDDFLRSLGLPFGERDLRADAKAREPELVAAYRQRRTADPRPYIEDAVHNP